MVQDIVPRNLDFCVLDSWCGEPSVIVWSWHSPCRGGEKPEDDGVVVNGTDEEGLTEKLSHMWWSQVQEHVPCSYLIRKSFVFQTWGLLSQALKLAVSDKAWRISRLFNHYVQSFSLIPPYVHPTSSSK